MSSGQGYLGDMFYRVGGRHLVLPTFLHKSGLSCQTLHSTHVGAQGWVCAHTRVYTAAHISQLEGLLLVLARYCLQFAFHVTPIPCGWGGEPNP